MMETKDRPQTPEQRKILRLNRDNPDWTPKDIANAMTVGWISPQYCKRIIDDMELENNSSPTIGNMANVTKKNTNDEPEPEEEDADPTEDNEPVQYTSRPFSSLGAKTQDIITYIEENPDAILYDVQDNVDASPSYIKDVIIRHSEFIDDDAGVWETVQNPREIHSVDNIEDDLTAKIINTIQENPGKTRRDAADMINVSENHFGHIMESYEHLLPAEWCERFPSLSDGGKLPYNDGDKASQDGSDGAEKRGQIDTTNMTGGGSSSVSVDAPAVSADAESEEEMNDVMDSIFDDDGFLQTSKLQSKNAGVTVDEAEEAEVLEAADSVKEEDEDDGEMVTLDMTQLEPTDRFEVDEDAVDRLRDEMDALPAHLSGEMEGYRLGIKRALEALGLDD